MRLSVTLGIDVEEIELWPMKKVQRYLAYYYREPFGLEWFWLTQLTNVLANCMGRGKNTQPYKREQWMPFEQEQTQQEMANTLMNILRPTPK